MSKIDIMRRKQAPTPKPAEPVQGASAAPGGKPKKFKPKGPGGFDKQFQQKGRLPCGARFTCCWNGTSWKTQLVIPSGETVATFDAETSGLFKSLAQADDKFRLWEKEANGPGRGS